MQITRYRIKGRVQGVGFRHWTRQTAMHLGITGWVRNVHDGSVEALASGTLQQLEEFSTLLWQGPQHSKVLTIDFENFDTMLSGNEPELTTDPTSQISFNSFSIRYESGETI